MNFDASLKFGQIGEGYISRWLRGRGWHMLPVYETELDTGKGPRLFMAQSSDRSELIAPDMLAMRDGKFIWFEAKRKTRFSWYRIHKKWVTGIDKRHYLDYIEVQKQVAIPLWVLFLHTNSDAWSEDVRQGAPLVCPTGLFGGEITHLKDCINHESDKYGPTGMVYWSYETLTMLATTQDVMKGTLP